MFIIYSAQLTKQKHRELKAICPLSSHQFSSGFVEVNPNSKIPALLDRRAGANNQRVFESGSILLYLSEAFDGAFLPKVDVLVTDARWKIAGGPKRA